MVMQEFRQRFGLHRDNTGVRRSSTGARGRHNALSDPSKSACFLLVMVGWRPTYAASSLDLATSENRQSAADMKRRHTLRNYAGNRRMIDTAYELATREPSACRRDRFSDGEPATLCRGSVHAIK